jgi:4-hydroxybenzoate polyprenyltransferase
MFKLNNPLVKNFIHFLRLVRWPNLLFILLAESLFHFFIYKPLYPNLALTADYPFYFIVATSICIAAAGYIINDYFDVNIDQVNKPKMVVVGSFISRRLVIFWHLILSMAGVYLSLIVFPFQQYVHIHFSNLATILILWFYSTNFKRDFLIGNVVIAVLTAWTIGVVYFSKFTIVQLVHPTHMQAADMKFFKLMLLYSSFAFILTLIREALKDMEDMIGDEKFGCTTMPIAWGLQTTKVYVAVWLMVLILVLSIIQLYAIPFGWWIPIAYCITTIIAPLAYVLFNLKQAFTRADFNRLSNLIKFAMLMGILSMGFFYFLL